MIKVIFSFILMVVILMACNSSIAAQHKKPPPEKITLAKTMQQLLYKYPVPGAVLSYGFDNAPLHTTAV